MDNFREWLSDNLRYILLGLAVILLLIIAFFAIKLVRGIGSPKTSETETQAITETVTEAAKDDSENKLVKETADSELQQLVEQYYTAVAAQDYDTLQSISESFTDEDKKKVENASAIESYNNIAVYSKKGLTDGTYIVYAYCDAKITGIETMAPRLEELYVLTNADGKLVFGDTDSSQELQDYVLKMQTDADVQALVKDVNGLLDTAMEKDADLAAYLTPCGWNATDNLLVVIFALEKNAPWNSAASYLGRQLERTLSGTVALTQPQEITWIVNLSLMQRSNTPKREAIACVSKTISDLCRDYACKAGESRPFSTVTSLHAHREEARMALELGGTIDPSLWHYRFADYSLAHLLRYGTGTLEKHQLCHPALLDLIRHDEQNGTEYALTLASFLRNNQSPTLTAKALFIHRTSLLRRIERINKITALHLDDPDEVLHLLLSARLLNL